MTSPKTTLKPQDVLILLKIVAKGEETWFHHTIAEELGISQSEVSQSLTRSCYAGLIDATRKKVNRRAFTELLLHGIGYVFPQQPGPFVRGIATAHSAPPLNSIIHSEEKYVWPYAKGNERGQAIEPLYPAAVGAALMDKDLYELLSLVDALRVGKVREKEIAKKKSKAVSCMHNRIINIDTVAKVAEGLQELRERMVFIGGAVISLYTDDAAADEIRPTKDVDLTVDLGNKYAEVVELQERLAQLGIHPDPQGKSIASYRYLDIQIDIMPAEATAVGISNTWYKPGFDHLEQVTLSNGLTINLLSAPYFLATKLEAFNDRGKGDYYGSHDFEDIIYVLDNRTAIAEEITRADKDVRNYIREQLTLIKAEKGSHEILSMHIHPYIREERFPLLMEKIDLVLQ